MTNVHGYFLSCAPDRSRINDKRPAPLPRHCQWPRSLLGSPTRPARVQSRLGSHSRRYRSDQVYETLCDTFLRPSMHLGCGTRPDRPGRAELRGPCGARAQDPRAGPRLGRLRLQIYSSGSSINPFILSDVSLIGTDNGCGQQDGGRATIWAQDSFIEIDNAEILSELLGMSESSISELEHRGILLSQVEETTD